MSEASKQTLKKAERSLRSQILPTNFDKATDMMFEARKVHTEMWTEKINKAVDVYMQENPKRVPANVDNQLRKNMDRVIGFTAKALTEISEVLNIGGIDFELFNDESDDNYFIWRPGHDNRVNAAHAGGHKVGIHSSQFWNLVEFVRSSPYKEITMVPQTIAKLMAEEVGHIYVARREPGINAATLEANRIAQETGDNTAYDNDPGENALHEFAQDYADYVASIRRWPFD